MEIDSYLKDVEYWEHYAEDNNDINVQYWKNEQWGEECLGAHGFLFMGAFCNSGKFLFISSKLFLTNNIGSCLSASVSGKSSSSSFSSQLSSSSSSSISFPSISPKCFSGSTFV